MTTEDPQPVIVGAGIAGLSAALRLAQAGLRPLVLEANPTFAGGRLAARPPVVLEHHGQNWSFPGEHGIHGFWTQYRNLRALLAEHSVHPPFIPARGQEWVVGDGPRVHRAELGSWLRTSIIPAPFHYLSLFANPRFIAMFSLLDLMALPWVGSTLLAHALTHDPRRPDALLESMTVADLLWGWPESLRSLVFALARNGLSSDVGEVSLAGFLAFLRFYTLLRRDAGAFDYLAADPGSTIIDPLVEVLRSAGGTLIHGVRVTSLERQREGWQVRWERAGDANAAKSDAAAGAFTASQVILATDAPGTRAIVEAGASTSVDAAGFRWPHAQPSIVLRLWFRASPRLRAESGMCGGDCTIDNFFWLQDLQEPFQRWHEATGGSAVEAHIYSPRDLLEQPDRALVVLALHDLVRMFPELDNTLAEARVWRNPPTHAAFPSGPTNSHHLGVATPWPGVWCCGDWVRHETPAFFLERACVTGLAAANDVLEASGLPVRPLIAHAGPEPLARLLEAGYRGAHRGAVRLREAFSG